MPDMKQIAQEAAFWPSLSEIADDYGLPKYAVRRAIENGEVESIKLGKIRINPESLDRWLESRYRPGGG